MSVGFGFKPGDAGAWLIWGATLAIPGRADDLMGQPVQALFGPVCFFRLASGIDKCLKGSIGHFELV